MEVTTNIKKSDLIRLNLAIMPRTKSTYIALLIITLLVASLLIWKKGVPESSYDWFVITFASIIGGIIGTLISFLISVSQIIISSSGKNGVLGKHIYFINQEGLNIKNLASEGINKWEGILDIQSISKYIIFKITERHFHIIPHRSFASDEERKTFMQQSIDYWLTKQG